MDLAHILNLSRIINTQKGTMDINEINDLKTYIKSIKENFSKIESILKIFEDSQKIQQTIVAENENEFDVLKKLLYSSNWPNAVDPEMIVNDESEEDKFERADNIIEMVLPLDKNISILDVGCGEGHFVKKALEKDYVNVFGYDISKPEKNQFEWDTENCDLTTDWSKVIQKEKFDFILMFDVLDHLKNESQVNFLKKIKSVLSPNGTIFVRCHPWISRHGGHFYKQLNKAWLHLVFTEDEMKELNYICHDCLNKIYTPIANYEEWFNKARFKIISKQIERSLVEPFFENTLILKERIIKNTNMKKFPQFQMEQSFLDYKLMAL